MYPTVGFNALFSNYGDSFLILGRRAETEKMLKSIVDLFSTNWSGCMQGDDIESEKQEQEREEDDSNSEIRSIPRQESVESYNTVARALFNVAHLFEYGRRVSLSLHI